MWDASIALQAWEEVEPNFRGWAEAAGMAAAADGVLYRFAVKHIVPDAGTAVASHEDAAARLAAAAAAAEEARQVVAATEKAALEAVRLEAAEAGRAGAAAADEVTRVGLAPRSFLCLSLHPHAHRCRSVKLPCAIAARLRASRDRDPIGPRARKAGP